MNFSDPKSDQTNSRKTQNCHCESSAKIWMVNSKPQPYDMFVKQNLVLKILFQIALLLSTSFSMNLRLFKWKLFHFRM